VFCSKCRTCTILAHSQGPRWMRKPVLSLCPSLCPRADLKALSGGQDQLHRLTSLLAHRGGLHQGKAHWLDLPLQPLPPCIKRRAAYSVLLTERLYRLPTLLLTGNQLAPVLPSLRHPLLVAHATTMRPSTPCGLVVFIGCLPLKWAYRRHFANQPSGLSYSVSHFIRIRDTCPHLLEGKSFQLRARRYVGELNWSPVLCGVHPGIIARDATHGSASAV